MITTRMVVVELEGMMVEVEVISSVKKDGETGVGLSDAVILRV